MGQSLSILSLSIVSSLSSLSRSNLIAKYSNPRQSIKTLGTMTKTKISSSSSSSTTTTTTTTIVNDSKVLSIMSLLDKYFPDPPVPLNSNDPFTFLCSVILSAQTTDGKVNEVTKILWDDSIGGNDPYKLKDLTYEKVQSIIQPVGLSQAKAKYLIGTAQMICEEYNGKIPNTLDDLQKLPGVGRKTASVVMSQVYGEPNFAVDTHVHRLAQRWGLSKHTDVNKVQEDLMLKFPKEHWNKLHLQFIYFGRQFCTAKDHVNSDCPMCSWVNKTGASGPSSDIEFTPKKKSKGIVFYEDRLNELEITPSLSYCNSPTSPLISKVKKETNETNEKKRKNNIIKEESDSKLVQKNKRIKK